MAVSGQRLCVTLSGGVDSVALLFALRSLQDSLGFGLAALHVNHGLSPNADHWQAHCSALCGSLSVPLAIHRVRVRRDDPRGLEAAARDARYRVFASADADCLVLAHHQGDQAETLLHRLVRGAGVRGAAAMASESLLVGEGGLPIRLLRPLLAFPKVCLEQFAREQGGEWVTDESNGDLRHARNFLRAEILPRLNERFPGADKALCRATQIFGEVEGLLVELAKIDLASARIGDSLVIDKLGSLGEPRGRNLLRYLLDQFVGLPPEMDRLCEAYRQVLQARPDRAFEVRFGGVRLVRFDGHLYFLRASDIKATSDWHWAGEERVTWGAGVIEFVPACGEGLSLCRIKNGGLFVRCRQGGERISIVKSRPRRSIKQLFSEYRVPPWQRAGMPLVWCDEVLVAVGDLAIDPDFVCKPGEPGLKVCWYPSVMLLSLPPHTLI